MTKTNLEIEEEFKVWMKDVEEDNYDTSTYTNLTDDIAKWWTKKLQQRMDEIEGKLEKLAELEHEQWVKWSQNLHTTEKISPERLERWEKLWKPYEDLTEEEKEQDRIWARKVLNIIKSVDKNK